MKRSLDIGTDTWVDWQNDWCKAAYELCNARLDNEQEKILQAIQNEKMVSVRSGTSRGKDFVSALAAYLFLQLTVEFDENGDLIKNTKVAMTAPTHRQVSNIMFPEVTRFHNAACKVFPMPGRFVANDIRTEHEEWFLTGFKADNYNEEAWTGFHAVNTMFVVTEASGIPERTWSAIEGNLQGNSRLLIVFNPNRVTGYAANSVKSNRFKPFRLNCLKSPNVENFIKHKQGEITLDEYRKIEIPGQVDYEWVKDKVDTWCEQISENDFIEENGDFEFEHKFYRPNDLFRIKVLGLFPHESEDVLIPLTWIEAAEKRYLEAKANGELKLEGKQNLGVDVAGMGRDSSMLCIRYKNIVPGFKQHQSGGRADHMHVVGMVLNQIDKNKNPKKNQVFIDTIGEGAGVYSRLSELGYNNVYSCKFSEGAKGLTDVTNEYEFTNMRSYLYWAIRDWLNPVNKNNPMLAPNSHLKEELTNTKWNFTSQGQIQIEPKEKIKERIKRSPDFADALVNTFYPNADKKGMTAKQLSEIL